MEEREKERERNIAVREKRPSAASCVTPTGDQDPTTQARAPTGNRMGLHPLSHASQGGDLVILKSPF